MGFEFYQLIWAACSPCLNPQLEREDDQGRMLSRFAMEEESSSDSGSSNGDEAAEEIEEDEMAMDMAQVIDT